MACGKALQDDRTAPPPAPAPTCPTPSATIRRPDIRRRPLQTRRSIRSSRRRSLWARAGHVRRSYGASRRRRHPAGRAFPGHPGARTRPLPHRPDHWRLRYFTLLDDITFARQRRARLHDGIVQRGGRYTWAYMLHKLAARRRRRPLVDLTVVVYAGRNTRCPAAKHTYAAAGDANDTAVSLSFRDAAEHQARQLDSRHELQRRQRSVHGDFYRVVSVTQPSTTLEPGAAGRSPSRSTQMTVMDNVVEVFERGTGDSSTVGIPQRT